MGRHSHRTIALLGCVQHRPFRELLAEARDDETRVTLVELLAEEREGIRRLASRGSRSREISSPPGAF